MTTTKIDSLNLPADLVTKLRTEVLYDDATLEAATAADVAGLPVGLKIRLRTVFPNLAEKPASDAGSHAPVGRVNPLLAGLTDRSDATKAIVSKIAEGMKAAKADVESLLRGLRLSPPPVDPRPSTLTDADLQHRISKAAADLVERRVTKIDFLNKEFARDTDTDLLARRCAALARADGYGAEIEGYRGSGCCVMLSRRRPG